MLWDYQKDAKRAYRENWNITNRQRQTEYRRKYRKEHREETLEQWRKDTRRYRERHDPEQLKKRNAEYQRRYVLRKKAERKFIEKQNQ